MGRLRIALSSEQYYTTHARGDYQKRYFFFHMKQYFYKSKPQVKKKTDIKSTFY